jgi:hypothetical protein
MATNLRVHSNRLANPGCERESVSRARYPGEATESNDDLFCGNVAEPSLKNGSPMEVRKPLSQRRTQRDINGTRRAREPYTTILVVQLETKQNIKATSGRVNRATPSFIERDLLGYAVAALRPGKRVHSREAQGSASCGTIVAPSSSGLRAARMPLSARL